MSWAKLAHERAELTMSWAELSELAHFDTPTYLYFFVEICEKY